MLSEQQIQKLNSIKDQANKYDALLESLYGSKSTIEDMINTTKTKLIELDDSIKLNNDISKLLQAVSEKSQDQISKVEMICTSALKEIFNDPDLSFKILIEKKRNSMSTSFLIKDSKIGLVDIVHGEAGGTKNIISIVLRLIFAELYSPKVLGPIILDESGGNISSEYQEGFGMFLKKFSKLTGRQILLVSHQAAVISEADNKISIYKKGSCSYVR